MKLYYLAGACSLAPHIVAREAGVALEIEAVDVREKRTASGKDFRAINPKGSVPALELDNGEILTEGPAIIQYLADLKPATGLAPANGTMARYRLQEMLAFLSSEVHKRHVPFFYPAYESVRALSLDALYAHYALLEQRLSAQEWLVGEHFTGADAYLFTLTTWAGHVGLDLARFPAVSAFRERVAQRPAVRAALEAEGLLNHDTR
ncbi:glutathione transferase GstA [Paraburkholderia unamae]|uniref:Glutathione S-transferase n=1 Tax=Paraburkholderia unamae TaxID=219649 RepID=A0ABX5KA23_9BURK|nr:glutathione transferase GstA [Paraburkholderia unamae]PVX71639.1 glutathione S-transferase [Paraburkholderia unamae]CAG9274740.1 Glutathione S-transferase GST-6.0 [Paraburkholderia unamae]